MGKNVKPIAPTNISTQPMVKKKDESSSDDDSSSEGEVVQKGNDNAKKAPSKVEDSSSNEESSSEDEKKDKKANPTTSINPLKRKPPPSSSESSSDEDSVSNDVKSQKSKNAPPAKKLKAIGNETEIKKIETGQGAEESKTSHNKWEAMDFGDANKTEKFRRLMGIKANAPPPSVTVKDIKDPIMASAPK